MSGGFALVAAATSLLPVGSLALAGGGVGLLGEFGLGIKLNHLNAIASLKLSLYQIVAVSIQIYIACLA